MQSDGKLNATLCIIYALLIFCVLIICNKISIVIIRIYIVDGESGNFLVHYICIINYVPLSVHSDISCYSFDIPFINDHNNYYALGTNGP